MILPHNFCPQSGDLTNTVQDTINPYVQAVLKEPQPQRFHYSNIRIFKDKPLGKGSYGGVYKAMCDLLPCAAKLLHPILVQSKDPGSKAQTPRRQFEQECHFLSTMKHPHIIQYLGTTHDPDSGLPVLLMELMDESLTHFLKRSQQPLSYHVESATT